MLRRYYEVLERAVNAYEATLIRFFGDGAMVLLNAPVSVPDPALRAVAMASDMQREVQELLAGWRTLEGRLGFGVGIAMGPATVGRIGSEGRLDYTAVGNVVNLASRLCDSARGQRDPGGPRRRPGDRCRHSSRAARGAAPQGTRPARSRVRRQPTGVCRRSGRMSCFESAAYRVRALEVRTRLALESKATSGTFSPFSSYRMARTLGANPGNHRKFKGMRALKILDGEDACARQSPGACERQSSALPRLRCQPVLFKSRRFASADVYQLCPRDPPTNPL